MGDKVKITEVEIGRGQVERIPSPGLCIYCRRSDRKLTDEHVIPYALAANSIILERACCESCQRIIQPYEQEVLRKQLGNFRAQVQAPTRTRKKDRPENIALNFAEVSDRGVIIRDLGERIVPLEQAPLLLSLWSSPAPRLLRKPDPELDETGGPWTYHEKAVAEPLSRQVAEETGSKIVALRMPGVNRIHYLRSLAKMAHAYAAAKIGLDLFEPFLQDLILTKSDDVAKYVGDSFLENPFDDHPAHTTQISIGEATDEPVAGFLVARIQLYPSLKSPAHLVVVGKATGDISERLGN